MDSDYVYVTPEALNRATAETLARLELEKHQVRLVMAIKGEDDSTMISEYETAAQALSRLDDAINRIKKDFLGTEEATNTEESQTNE